MDALITLLATHVGKQESGHSLAMRRLPYLLSTLVDREPARHLALDGPRDASHCGFSSIHAGIAALKAARWEGLKQLKEQAAAAR